jgi:hypothetical protein
MKKIFFITIIAAFCLAAIMGIATVLFNLNFTPVEGRIILTTVAVGFFSLELLCQSLLFEKGEAKVFGYVGFAITVIELLLVIIAIWNGMNAWFGRTIFDGLILSIFITHVSLMCLISPNHQLVKASLTGTLVFSTITTAMVIYLITLKFNDYTNDEFFRFTIVFFILAVLGTVVTPILHKITKRL